MIKKVTLRGLMGMPLGVFISSTILLMISLILGEYTPAAPALVEQTGSTLRAVTLQYLLSALCGCGYGACSVIWEMESCSPLKQMIIGISLYALFTLPIAYFCYWMEHTIVGFLLYLGIFVVIFLLIWGLQYGIGKSRVKKITRHIQDSKPE